MRFVEESRVTSVALTAEDIEMLLNRLLFDGLVTKVTSMAVVPSRIVDDDKDDSIYVYKATINNNEKTESMLAGMPCGCCPVATQCHDSGPVTPQRCPYFTEWLSF